MIELKKSSIKNNAVAYFVDPTNKKKYRCDDIRKALSSYEVFNIFMNEPIRISKVRLEKYFVELKK